MSKKEETTKTYTVFSVFLCVLLLSVMLFMYYRLHFQNNTTDSGRVQRLLMAVRDLSTQIMVSKPVILLLTSKFLL